MKDPKKPIAKGPEKAAPEKPKEKKIAPFPEIYEPPVDYRVRPKQAVEGKLTQALSPERLQKPTRTILLKMSEKERREEELRTQKLISMKENLRDSQQFMDWQQRQRANDEAAKLQEVRDTKVALEKQRLLMLEALEKKREENQGIAQEMHKASEAAKKRQEREDLKRQARVQSLKSRVKKISENFREAQEQTLQQKKNQAVALKADIGRQLDVRNAEEFEALARRKEAVARIRAYEEEIRKSGGQRAYDLFVAKHKNMELMDLEELNKMYANLKGEFEEQVAAKRAAILSEKQREKERLEQLEKKMEAQKDRKARLAELQKQERLEKEREAAAKALADQQKREEETLLKLLEKREAKAREAAALEEVENEIKQKKLFFNQQKDRYERIKNENIQLGKERVVSVDQNSRLVSAIDAQTVKLKSLKNLGRVKQAEATAVWKRQTNYQRELEEAARRRGHVEAADMDYKKSQVKKIRELSGEVKAQRNS